MIKNIKKIAVLIGLVVCLTGCTDPTAQHTHEVQEITTEEVVGYAWERNDYFIWNNMLYLDIEEGYATKGMYAKLGKFRDRASFIVERTVDGEQNLYLISFDITDVHTYAQIMQHLYEPFNICIDNITYTDGCTTKQFRLIGLVEEE